MESEYSLWWEKKTEPYKKILEDDVADSYKFELRSEELYPCFVHKDIRRGLSISLLGESGRQVVSASILKAIPYFEGYPYAAYETLDGLRALRKSLGEVCDIHDEISELYDRVTTLGYKVKDKLNFRGSVISAKFEPVPVETDYDVIKVLKDFK